MLFDMWPLKVFTPSCNISWDIVLVQRQGLTYLMGTFLHKTSTFDLNTTFVRIEINANEETEEKPVAPPLGAACAT